MIVAAVLIGLLFFAGVLAYFAFKKDTYPTPPSPQDPTSNEPKPL